MAPYQSVGWQRSRVAQGPHTWAEITPSASAALTSSSPRWQSQGYFADLADYPWVLAFLVLIAVWVVGPLILLVLGLIDLPRRVRLRWWFAVGWLSALTGSTAIGHVILHDFRLLLTAFPRDTDGTPLGPSRFAPGAPYWDALIAASGATSSRLDLPGQSDVAAPMIAKDSFLT
jgi:hypothetical protein